MRNIRKPRTLGTTLYFGLLFLMAALAFPSVARANNYIGTWSGQNAYAFFLAPDPSDPLGCRMYEALISANVNDMHNPPGPITTYAQVYLFAATWDQCTGNYFKFFQDTKDLTTEEFVVSEQIAKVRTKFQTVDHISGLSYPIVIDLTWSATGPPTKQSGNQVLPSPDGTFLYRWSGMYRPADATGTVSDGTLDFTQDEVSWDGNFGKGTFMSLAVTH